MRFSSLVSLVVVTASFALGGCAADAEPSSSFDDDIVKLDGDLDGSRTRDVRAVSQHADEASSPVADATRARNIETYGSGAANPRIDAPPPVFGLGRTVLVPAGELVKDRDGLTHDRVFETLEPAEMVGVVDDHTAAAARRF